MCPQSDRDDRAPGSGAFGADELPPELRAHNPDVIDPDVDLHDPDQRAETFGGQWDILAAIAVGGVLGAESRYGLGLLLPRSGSEFPWATLIVNTGGSLLIGVLMSVILEFRARHRLVRPFLGVGLLGGYTTFSTFAVDADRLVNDQRPLLALGYVAATVSACLGAVLLGTLATKVAIASDRTSRWQWRT